MKRLFCLLLLVVSVASVQGQDVSTSRPIANADIVEMSRAGLLPAVLIAKIKSSECKFDTSPSALVALKEAGVADDVLMEMVRNSSGSVQPNVQPLPSSSPVAATSQQEVKERPGDNLPEYGDISEIRKLRRVFVIADDIDSQSLMIKALRQYDGLDVVSSPERAELFVAFTQASTATSMVLRGLFPGTINHRTKAQFVVYYKSDSGRSRIVWQETEEIQTSSGLTISRPNEVNVIRHFIKAMKKIRGE
ncbi:MAG TPA: hypothetical protein VFY60_02850 [Pyrinomonadaceae bacterium]|nr:hypothetical protein [Pyrinomonadaceae bacterium]